jgi:hypothetical protein
VAGLIALHDTQAKGAPKGFLSRALSGAALAGPARAFERALAGARRFGLPYEEARAHLALARLGPAGSPETEKHDLAAHRILAALECPAPPLSAEPPHKEYS